jgi:cystathionine beta-lyase
MRTLHLRMQKHAASAVQVATWLEELPQIKQVLFPALPSDPGHALWKKQFTGAPGPFTVELQSCGEPAFEQFINSLQLFGLGTSWGGYESLVMPAIPHHLRALPVQPDEGRLVRFHIGLESPADLCEDIGMALKHIGE